jgi:hypothetical protein
MHFSDGRLVLQQSYHIICEYWWFRLAEWLGVGSIRASATNKKMSAHSRNQISRLSNHLMIPATTDNNVHCDIMDDLQLFHEIESKTILYFRGSQLIPFSEIRSGFYTFAFRLWREVYDQFEFLSVL